MTEALWQVAVGLPAFALVAWCGYMAGWYRELRRQSKNRMAYYDSDEFRELDPMEKHGALKLMGWLVERS